ncbi:3-hydroxyacyl-CoA dehydrogenase [Amycolatopsis sp. WAC 04197]|uniref:3-hydroxyacyl-CoA dehydrogenase family protein n=1 Tax=Amycolatopsis sp. WAC 04197 TaxID=2203199 RepID=UPI000F76B9E6|nr:3-hydroxyacyl-CoA dehydrogenase family protein [Amycolatopsis sp. WAC 04197]RSN45176.1 3-hydroxyacyl-CoA dehydrogenase [Amycolatopsis sp. WAC 04197]
MRRGSKVTPPVAIIGGGSMGVSIAAVFVGHGISVVVVERDPERRGTLASRVTGAVRHGRLLGRLPERPSVGGLTVTGDFGDIAGVTTVVEAVTEILAEKHAVFDQARAIVVHDAIFVSCTSSFTIASLAGAMPDASTLIGVHFMNPAYLVDAVEVVRGPATSLHTVERITRLLGDIGRTPVFVGDGVGFVTSRLLHQMINDAALIVQEGLADAASVDTIMEAALGHPMGPLRTADLIGIDNLVDSIRAQAAQDRTRFAGPCKLLRDMADSGELGRKSGRGFYEYQER